MKEIPIFVISLSRVGNWVRFDLCDPGGDPTGDPFAEPAPDPTPGGGFTPGGATPGGGVTPFDDVALEPELCFVDSVLFGFEFSKICSSTCRQPMNEYLSVNIDAGIEFNFDDTGSYFICPISSRRG